MNKIEVTIEQSVPSKDWQRVALRRTRLEAKLLGIEWKDAEILVFLPERGRCFTKPAGGLSLLSQG